MTRHADARWRAILADLDQRLLSGSLLPGMRLPSEMALARQWNCSRQTVRTALLRLADGGRLRRRVGRGWFVATRARRSRGAVAWLGHCRQPASTLLADHDLTVHSDHLHGHDGQGPSLELAAVLANDPSIQGVVLTSMRPIDQRFLDILAAAGKPCLIIGLACTASCDVVACDFADASARLVDAAQQRGCNSITFLGRHLHAELPPFRARVDGMVHRAAQHGLQATVAIAPHQIYEEHALCQWYEAQFLAAPSEALIIDVQPTARLITTLHQHRSIPGQLRLAGYGNSAVPSDLHLPVGGIDAVYEPWDDLHALAAKRLIDRLDGDGGRPALHLVRCDLLHGGTGLVSADHNPRH